MKIVKCDACKKELPSNSDRMQLAYASSLDIYSFDLCNNCSKPIINILKNKKLIKIGDKKNERRK